MLTEPNGKIIGVEPDGPATGTGVASGTGGTFPGTSNADPG